MQIFYDSFPAMNNWPASQTQHTDVTVNEAHEKKVHSVG